MSESLQPRGVVRLKIRDSPCVPITIPPSVIRPKIRNVAPEEITALRPVIRLKIRNVAPEEIPASRPVIRLKIRSVAPEEIAASRPVIRMKFQSVASEEIAVSRPVTKLKIRSKECSLVESSSTMLSDPGNRADLDLLSTATIMKSNGSVDQLPRQDSIPLLPKTALRIVGCWYLYKAQPIK